MNKQLEIQILDVQRRKLIKSQKFEDAQIIRDKMSLLSRSVELDQEVYNFLRNNKTPKFYTSAVRYKENGIEKIFYNNRQKCNEFYELLKWYIDNQNVIKQSKVFLLIVCKMPTVIPPKEAIKVLYSDKNGCCLDANSLNNEPSPSYYKKDLLKLKENVIWCIVDHYSPYGTFIFYSRLFEGGNTFDLYFKVDSQKYNKLIQKISKIDNRPYYSLLA